MRCFRGLTKGLQEPKLRSEKADFWSNMVDSRPGRADFRTEKADFRPRKLDCRSQTTDFGPERPEGGDKQMNERTNKQKSPCVLQNFVPFGGAAQKPEIARGWAEQRHDAADNT